MKTVFVLSISLTACSLTASEPEPYRLTLEPQSPPTIPKAEPLSAASDEMRASPPKESISKRMILVMRVVSQTQQLEKQFEILKSEASGKTWETLKPEQRASASSAASLAGKLQKEVTALRSEIASFPDPSRVIGYIFNAEIVLKSYDDFFSSLLHRK